MKSSNAGITTPVDASTRPPFDAAVEFMAAVGLISLTAGID